MLGVKGWVHCCCRLHVPIDRRPPTTHHTSLLFCLQVTARCQHRGGAAKEARAATTTGATVTLSRTPTTRIIIDTTTIAESEKNDDGGESGSGESGSGSGESGESGSGSGSSGVLSMAGALSCIAEAIVARPFDIMVKTPTSDQSGNESRSIQDAIAIAP